MSDHKEIGLKMELAKFFKDGNKYDVDVSGLCAFIFQREQSLQSKLEEAERYAKKLEVANGNNGMELSCLRGIQRRTN